MHDIIDVIKNLQTLSESNNSFSVLKDFERVIDELDLYVYKNWNEGEIVEGPNISRYDVSCKFMWPRNEMPDPQGGKRLVEYGCQVTYKKDHILVPRQIKDPKDYRPGTKKGKIDAHPIWIVEIKMPKKLMEDVKVGSEFKEQNKLTELMRYSQENMPAGQNPVTPDTAAQEAPTQ